ncbi:MAG TPA: hypothetical protein VGF81_14160 [Solirubrobacteraceae bacterium]
MALAALVVVLVTSCGGSKKKATATTVQTTTTAAPAPPQKPQAPPRPSMVTIFGDPARLASTPGPALDTYRSLGVDYVRVTVPFAGLVADPTATSPPSGFDGSSPSSYPASKWATYDNIVLEAKAHGIGVIMDPGSPVPTWATGSGEPAGGLPYVWKPNAAAFGAFVHALGVRYSGHYTPPGASSPLPRVNFWSVWNEPNYGPELAPQAIDHSTVEVAPALYRGLVDSAWAALHDSGHGHDRILFGEFAPRGRTTGDNPGNFSGMVPLRFVRALYCVDSNLRPLQGSAATERGCPSTASASKQFPSEHPALFGATGVAVHPYPQGALAPNVVVPNEPDYADLANLPHLEKTLDSIQRAYGQSKQFDLYSTEFGYKTNPPTPLGPPLVRAAAYLNWSEYISWRDPRIRAYNQYLLTDPPPTASHFDTGLEFLDGTLKPSYGAFRLPIYLPSTNASNGNPLTVWGCVRPAHFASGPQHVRIEFDSGKGGFRLLKTVPITNRNGYFDTSVRFSSSGTVRLAWSYPHGPTIHSLAVHIAG